MNGVKQKNFGTYFTTWSNTQSARLLIKTGKSDKDVLLVAVDFSPYSEQALCFAGQLAEKLKARLLVLHVIHDP